ncbi:MAG TPA: leucyl aminopeptidase [Solirubrobacteraceae bacterium]|nr:leucyl aminopeptidase [Solirubrobacteraceae bacterium]
MRITATTQAPLETGADTIAIGIFEGEGIPHEPTTGSAGGARDEPLGALLEAGEAKAKHRHLAVAHAEGRRWILVGLGDRDAFDGERARIAAAAVHGRARELGTSRLCWEVPHHVDERAIAGLVQGTALSAYRFDRFRGSKADEDAGALEELVLSAHHDVGRAVERAAILAEAQNVARDLQNRPANDLTPTALAEAARELAAGIEGLDVDVRGREWLAEQRMGAFLAVAQGSDQEPALIELRYEGATDGPVLGLVGKAVTFDSGGISIKPASPMWNMKFDMSGGAAVVAAIAAIARLRLPVRVVGVVGATENLPSGHAVKPGDIVTARSGITIEVNNTDAEGRLVLADCLAWAIELGAERLVDVATLTGGVVTALGGVYAGFMANDDAWAGAVEAAGTASGELIWRLPLHELYAEQVKGTYADLQNASADRTAHPIQGAQFLARFAGDVPWAHLDIAGVSDNLARAYLNKGGTGFGVRLLVELAAAHSG